MEESTPELAATRYRRVIEGYKSRLRTNPNLKLSEYCKESHTNYRGVIDWTKRHGISILELRREARGETSGSTSAPQSDGAFIQFMPSSRSTFGNLRGTSITFPDGFLLYQKRLERGFFEMPRKNADTGYYELSWETFSFIMSGISLESVCFRKRYRTRFMGIQSFDYQ